MPRHKIAGEELTLDAGGLGSPSIPTSGLLTWLRADDLVASDGANITSWASREGLGSWTGSAATYRATGGPSGQPAVQANASVWTAPSAILSGATAGEYFAVVKAASAASDTPSMFGHLIGADRPYYPYNDGRIYETFGRNTGRLAFIPTLPITSWRIYSVRRDATPYWEASLDGVSQEVNTTGTVSFDSGTPNLFGVDGFNWAGHLSELILYNRVLTEEERYEVMKTLSDFYGLGLTLTPPGGTGPVPYRKNWNFVTGLNVLVDDDFSAGTGSGWTSDGDATVNWTATGVSNYAVEGYGSPYGNTIVRTVAAQTYADASCDFKGASTWADGRRHVPILLKSGGTPASFIEIYKDSGVYYLRLCNNTHQDPPALVTVALAIDPSDGFHTYRLVVDFDEDNALGSGSVGTAQVYVDGTQVISLDSSIFGNTYGNVASTATYDTVGFILDSGYWNHHGFVDNFLLSVTSGSVAVTVTDDSGNDQTVIDIPAGAGGLVEDQWAQFSNNWNPNSPSFPYYVNLGDWGAASALTPFIDEDPGRTDLSIGKIYFAETGLYTVNFMTECLVSSFPASPHGYRIQNGGRSSGWESSIQVVEGGAGTFRISCSIQFCDWIAANDVLRFLVSRGTTITSVPAMNVYLHLAKVLDA